MAPNDELQGKATQTTERASHTHHLKERGAKVLIFFPHRMVPEGKKIGVLLLCNFIYYIHCTNLAQIGLVFVLISVSFKNCSAYWRWVYTPVISTPGEGRQKDLSSEASLGYIVIFCLQNQELEMQLSSRGLPSTY